MIDQPELEYVVRTFQNDEQFMGEVEALIPGCMVYLRRDGKRWARLKNVNPDYLDARDEWRIKSPLHAAWLVERMLNHLGVRYWCQATTGSMIVQPWSNSPESRLELQVEGERLLDQSISRKEVREYVRDLATPYQLMGVAWAHSRPYAMNVWACGSGKTLGAIMSSTARKGDIVVVCPAKARHVWWSQVQEYTNIKPFRVRPKAEIRKKDQTFAEYTQECRMEGRRRFVIVGAESIADNVNLIRGMEPRIIIFDEIHTHGNSKRWKAVHNANGTVRFEKRKTSASNNPNSAVNRHARAVSIMEVSRIASVQLRIGLTATPLDDGRPRRLWSQLDLLAPGGFSHSYSNFARRYCAARPGTYGGLDDGGSSNIEELKARCSFMVHEVPYSESHSSLPSTRVQVDYLTNSELNRADRFSDDQTFTQAVRQINRETGKSHDGRERVVEVRLAEACSRKRKYVIEEAIEGLKGGGKVVIFTARRRETELWAHQLRNQLSKGDEAQKDVPVWMAHGGVPETERDEMVDAFRSSDGACCLVATGQSVGTGVDGMQTANLAIFAMLPWKPGDFVQWKGRFDRLGGSPTLLKVVVAQGTYDERVVQILVDKFGPIETFLKADELDGLGEKLLGMEDEDALVSSIINKLEVA
ncbi:MAG: hypothetical protein GOVbin2277_63 [Prokaryotic dsDNA virus sp.]|nr:MAG: hypothetical protein GOVbin2277_63 [Prokaryotic dsDNA virus sp.]